MRLPLTHGFIAESIVNASHSHHITSSKRIRIFISQTETTDSYNERIIPAVSTRGHTVVPPRRRAGLV